MNRDNFSPKTKNELGSSVGFQCVRPGCGRITKAYDPGSQSIVNIGIAAHDSSASPGGPRFNDDLSPEQRKAFDNGACLCSHCARLVDVLEEYYPIGTIRSWQEKAMKTRLLAMAAPQPVNTIDYAAACRSARQFLDYQVKIYICPTDMVIRNESIITVKDLIAASRNLAGGTPLNAQYPHIVGMQQQIIDAYVAIIKEIQYSGFWFVDEFNYYRLRSDIDFSYNQEGNLQRKQRDSSQEKIQTLLEDIYKNCCDIENFIATGYPHHICDW